ncbi:hypothetical protein RRG08_059721 [Elysia crispata]|uniref:Uncharacterized protein n=1 Tax=Elysia crispata TaxID=231223 RepID=A0AAE0YNM1_9GAST|nr:hypothetical protein RRG08_059721 [Elysia crispata]
MRPPHDSLIVAHPPPAGLVGVEEEGGTNPVHHDLLSQDLHSFLPFYALRSSSSFTFSSSFCLDSVEEWRLCACGDCGGVKTVCLWRLLRSGDCGLVETVEERRLYGSGDCGGEKTVYLWRLYRREDCVLVETV